MQPQTARPQWATRVSRFRIAMLYHRDALGLRDEALVDEAGLALLTRVESILAVTAAHSGLIKCCSCGQTIEHRLHQRKGSVIPLFACGWSIGWEISIVSYRKKQLLAGGMEGFFREFAESYPHARTYEQKMLLIDGLIHRYHWELQGTARPVGAVNLIGGTLDEVVAFLNELTYGPACTPELQRNQDAWRQKLAASQWGGTQADERLRQTAGMVTTESAASQSDGRRGRPMLLEK